MSKNKKILITILGIIVAIILVMLLSLEDGTKKNNNTSTNGAVKVWILEDDASKFQAYLTKFKELNQGYKNTQFQVETFDSYKEYSYALSHAFMKDEGPDVFMLNNSEKESIFSEQTLGFNPNIINPQDFRRKFKGAIANDLIQTTEFNGEMVEFLKGVPVGYETLGIFHNRRYVKTTDLASFSTLNKVISKYAEEKPSIVPIAMGNGSTVEDAADIISQFLLLEGDVTGITDLSSSILKQTITPYYLFGDSTGKNGYNNKFESLSRFEKNNLDMFSEAGTFMVVGYPRTINKIAEKGYTKALLLASPFPQYYTGEGKALMNYNYFVVNKDSQNITASQDLLSFMTTDLGAEEYLKIFPYYFPALLSLEEDALETNIHEKYNIVLNDFYNPDVELQSFDKGLKVEFDEAVIAVLDNSTNYLDAFEKFIGTLRCRSGKVISLEGLSKSCGK